MARREPDRHPVYRWLPGLQPAPDWRGRFLLIRFLGPARAPGSSGYAAGPDGDHRGCGRPGRARLAGGARVSMLAACPGVDGLRPVLALIAAGTSRWVGPLWP